MTARFHSLLLAAALSTAFHTNAFAADGDKDDQISTDRPGVVESSQAIAKGRVQLETSIQWDRLRNSDEHTRTLYSPTLLRIGLGRDTELRIETDGRVVEHSTDPSTGSRSVTAGWADTELGVKWHLMDQQGKDPSLGVLLHAELPSGSRELRGKGVRPSLRLSAEWELADGYALGVMPGVALESNDTGAHYGYGILAASLGKDVGERTHGFVELAAEQIASSRNGGTQASIDTGFTYALGRDMQVDFSLMHGLNRRSPDLSLAFGLSIRR